jgi:alpha(1,3/1,4) fucosyltransferase
MIDGPLKIKFTDFWHDGSEEEIKTSNPIYILLIKRFQVDLSGEPDFVIYSCFGKAFLKHRCTRIFYTGENVRPNFKECDYSFGFDYVDDKRNYRLPLYKFYTGFENLTTIRSSKDICNIKTKFCNILISNPNATKRIDFFKRLSKYKQIDSGGRLFNNIGYRVNDRVHFLQPYKFTIAFENSSYPGYTTEKLIMPWLCNSIPIYWGNPLIHLEFNTKSFINCHEYDSFEEVIERVIEIDNSDELYMEYLQQPLFHGNEMPHYLTDQTILDRFEAIFRYRLKKPVGETWWNEICKVKYESRDLWMKGTGRLRHILDITRNQGKE